MGMELSVVIVSWNTKHMLYQCLRSIQDALPQDLARSIEVVVVDNASSDGSGEMVQQHYPWVQLLQNSENVGFARGNNLGIQRCTGRYVLLLNPDTEVKTGAFEALLEFMDTHPQVGAAGSRLLNANGTLQRSCYPEPTLAREFWRLFHLDLFYPYGSYWVQKWSADVAREVDSVQGACLMVREAALQQVGLLDESYFIYTEEIDLCYRIRQAGWHIYWVPRAQVIHYGGQSTRQVAPEMFLQLYRSKLLYFRKHRGPVAAAIYKLILFGAGMIRLVLYPLARLQAPAIRRQSEALAEKYRQLLHTLPQM